MSAPRTTSPTRWVERLPRSRHREPVEFPCTPAMCQHGGCRCDAEALAFARVIAPAVITTYTASGAAGEERIER